MPLTKKEFEQLSSAIKMIDGTHISKYNVIDLLKTFIEEGINEDG